MRNRVSALTALLLMLAWPALGWGQAAGTPAGPFKIGVINLQQAIAQTAEGKQAFAKLRDKFAPRQADLQKQQQEVENLRDQIQRQATTLSDAERLRLSRELQEKQKLYRRAAEDLQSDAQDDRQDIITRIGKKMVRVIDEYAKANGYQMIIDDQVPVYGEQQTYVAQIPVYFAADGVDVTPDVVKRYDAQYPVTPAAGASSGNSAKPAATKPPSKP